MLRSKKLELRPLTEGCETKVAVYGAETTGLVECILSGSETAKKKIYTLTRLNNWENTYSSLWGVSTADHIHDCNWSLRNLWRGLTIPNADIPGVEDGQVNNVHPVCTSSAGKSPVIHPSIFYIVSHQTAGIVQSLHWGGLLLILKFWQTKFLRKVVFIKVIHFTAISLHYTSTDTKKASRSELKKKSQKKKVLS